MDGSGMPRCSDTLPAALDLLLVQRAERCDRLREDADHGLEGQRLKAEIADLNDRITAQIVVEGLGRSGMEEPKLMREPVMGGTR